jgi:hypothetical protein
MVDESPGSPDEANERLCSNYHLDSPLAREFHPKFAISTITNIGISARKQRRLGKHSRQGNNKQMRHAMSD